MKVESLTVDLTEEFPGEIFIINGENQRRTGLEDTFRVLHLIELRMSELLTLSRILFPVRR